MRDQKIGIFLLLLISLGQPFFSLLHTCPSYPYNRHKAGIKSSILIIPHRFFFAWACSNYFPSPRPTSPSILPCHIFTQRGAS
ncbi:hypothetical protein DL89DRAFT_140195 [Linderina pennispora]|uniref:Secreted protein n=1 Tax=Linderina pennispora TaxID=61395 RepID=A0A1Y1WB68_9FUNG|nr:uncharacterized protein DL89DRAFT_140195 [Linderina pennispora]ORX70787.1 hypothetical protein DL89DRAFT_140195 [Linderina pennispora]